MTADATALAAHLLRRIAATGPLSVADYMAECLLHPEHGYYSTRDPLGAQGDFTTAPEISQMFGELLGLLLARCWMDQGSPAPFILAEPGPGRGTLMADMLRATRQVPGFHAAAHVHLVEASPTLRERQRKALGGTRVQWHERLESLPPGSLFLVANEFFDALPIRQFSRCEQGWCERRITAREGRLQIGLSPPRPLPALAHRLQDTRPGDIVETCAPAEAAIAEIGARIAADGGVAVVVDYGGWRSLGDTLQAVRNHAPEPVLANPGAADLTAHVDFEALARAAPPGVAHTPLSAQGLLLERLGIRQRAAMLAEKLRGNALKSHEAALHRLTDGTQMGTLFKALAFYPPGAPTPPGFSP